MIHNCAEHLVTALRPLLVAEVAAEAPVVGVDPDDLEQAVWVRLLEHLDRIGPPADPERWLRESVHAEACREEWAGARERCYGGDPAPTAHTCPERALLRAERRRLLRDAVRRLPARCATLVDALLSPRDLTYREIAGELGISQGSVGPERARCLERLRMLLAVEDFGV
ncbi:sigma-70 family RNA polymerase sigma factor [Streptomyces luteolus]|uniref:Sigma-70 family RNA polymerase sigma factor n=1 Tax=Streptomyces luteolus TaxID=3043615 RepID=A0ABT6SXC9_9ACTN|nr:sigma-70 family RNA polymerase sigma factor [Streptomyces sp. B-S-A12]MDI3420272.1 sigma-70 family RNA polymerase sigma factor [Streptomyces sp. B-S-A12]